MSFSINDCLCLDNRTGIKKLSNEKMIKMNLKKIFNDFLPKYDESIVNVGHKN